MAYPLKAFMFATAAGLTLSTSALAQTSSMSDYTRPYGQNHVQAGSVYSGITSAGNRVIVNGIMQTGVGVSPQVNAMTGLNLNITGGVQSNTGPFSAANATAIGNQLNVNVTGNYNTVIVNSNQVNNGAVSASANTDTESDNDQD